VVLWLLLQQYVHIRVMCNAEFNILRLLKHVELGTRYEVCCVKYFIVF